MIALPQSDRRYVVDTTVMPYYFPGTNIPVAWETTATLLDPKDPRHDIALPEPLNPIMNTDLTVL